MSKAGRSVKFLSIVQGGLGDALMVFCGLWAVKQHTGARVDILCPDNFKALGARFGLTPLKFSTQSSDFSSLYAKTISSNFKKIFSSYDMIMLFSFSRDLLEGVESVSTRVVQIFPRPEKNIQIHVLDHILGELKNAGLVNKANWRKNTELTKAFACFKPDAAHNRPILLHPGSGSPRKCWRLDRFLNLHKTLLSRGLKTKFVLGPADGFLRQKISSRPGPDAEVVAPDSLDLLADLLLGCRAYVGNDSGATHLAALLGVFCVAIFGPSDPARWRPVGPQVTVIRPKLTCFPCFETQPENCEEPKCLLETHKDGVLAALESVFF